MEYFNKNLFSNPIDETYAFIKLQEEEHTLTITLDRAKKKNAIHPKMIDELAFALQYAKMSKHIWAIVIAAEGNVFCAGADLKAFMGMLGEFESSIPKAEKEVLLGDLFNQVHKPVIAKIEGDVYAGGFFFLAGSTYVVANENVKLGLPEVKRGLYPFQVMAALLQVMPKRKVVDWCIRGYNLPVRDAMDFGLVTHLATTENIDSIVDGLIADLSENSPSAIRLGLESLDAIQNSESKHKYLMEMLQKTVASKDGQEGLTAFREKRKPIWTGE